MFYTYRITNTRNRKSYFGWTNKTPTKRWQVHQYSAAAGSHTLLHNAIRKHGVDAFSVEQVNIFETQDEAIADEARLIANHKTNHCRYPNGGYNMTDGGEGVVGFERTEAQSEASRRVITERNKSIRGKTYKEIYGNRAEEEKQKRTAIVEYVPTPDTKQKMAEAKINNKNGCFAVRIIHDDGRIELFPSHTDAMAALGIKTRTTFRCIATGKRWRNGK